MVTEIFSVYGSVSETAVDFGQNICMAVPNHEGSGSIEYICTVKKNDKIHDGKVEQYSLDDSNAAG